MFRSFVLVLAMAGCVVAGTGVATTTASGPTEPAPPPRSELVEPRPGFVFIAGQWIWQGQWVWIAGHWERERAAPPPVIVDVGPPPPSVPPPPTVLSPPSNPSATIALALGENHTCSLSAAGQIRCWGYNKRGSLGVGSQQDPGDGIVTGIDGGVRAIAAGGYQTCALTTNGTVWCWGSNHVGQVGSGAVSEAPVPRPTRVGGLASVRSLQLGDATSCAVTTDGKLYCWGDNSQHQIDDSLSKTISTATRVAGVDRADLVAVGNYHLCVATAGRVQCRGELAPLNAQLSTLNHVTALSAGWGHSCALQDGKPYCWGKSYLGILGAGDVCRGNGDCASALTAPAVVAGVEGATQLVGLDYHSCVLGAGGTVTCWGNNQGHSFSDALPAEPYQTAHLLPGVTADLVLVGGVHTCTLRAGVLACHGNDWAGAVRGAR
jgi:alpha-tubulin suppressor-like RCC1 family protein